VPGRVTSAGDPPSLNLWMTGTFRGDSQEREQGSAWSARCRIDVISIGVLTTILQSVRPPSRLREHAAGRGRLGHEGVNRPGGTHHAEGLPTRA
jgi:hypothetical protein